MIDLEDRFWVSDLQDDFVETKAMVLDWNQRRFYIVMIPNQFFPEGYDIFEDGDGLITDLMKRYIDEIERDVHTLSVDVDGLLLSTSSDPEKDGGYVVNYPSYTDCPSLHGCPTISSSSMTELDRLAPGVDLMSYVDAAGHENKVIYKWGMISQRRMKIWHELHFLQRLPRHPGLLPLDHIVVDDTTQEILGFTTPYVPGWDLGSSKRTDVFRIQHLKQLTEVVDLLNFDLGIAHQDVAPRNLLLDPVGGLQHIRLFDFDRAAVIGGHNYDAARNDIKGVLFTAFEMITQDDSYRTVDFSKQDAETILGLKGWSPKRQLDVDVSLHRRHLTEWMKQRRASDREPRERAFEIPEMPRCRVVIMDLDDQGKPIDGVQEVQVKGDVIRFGHYVTDWSRAPQRA